nr:MAG TPA: hypothetical protein [Caudoviricetes sp.]
MIYPCVCAVCVGSVLRITPARLPLLVCNRLVTSHFKAGIFLCHLID